MGITVLVQEKVEIPCCPRCCVRQWRKKLCAVGLPDAKPGNYLKFSFPMRSYLKLHYVIATGKSGASLKIAAKLKLDF